MKTGDSVLYSLSFAVLGQYDCVLYALCCQIISEYSLINDIILSYFIACSARFRRTAK